jgi:hypothetical protein
VSVGGEFAGAGADAPRRRRPQGGAAGASSLPCLNSNICTETPAGTRLLDKLNCLSTNHRKAAFKLTLSIARMCSRHGIERIGFLTLTFADHVTCAKQAGRRYHSLRSHVLRHRYTETICVLERMKSGRIHFHLLVILQHDIRTGFDFKAVARCDYRSVTPALLAEWKFWRETEKLYGFGRTHLLPVKSNEEGISRYVGKYIAKHVGAREPRDRSVRLVRYSCGSSIGSQSFMFVSPRSRLWRWQVGEFARRNGVLEDDFPAMVSRFGRRWAWSCREQITAIEPPPLVCAHTTDQAPVTLWDVWESDRASIAGAVAGALGCEHAEAYAGLFQHHRFPFTVSAMLRSGCK